ncbi:MAG: response regulator transcription factor, partial [Trueperaceae bacterium]
ITLAAVIRTPHKLIYAGLAELLKGIGVQVVQDKGMHSQIKPNVVLVDLCGALPPYPKPSESVPALALVCQQERDLSMILAKGYRGYLRREDGTDILLKALVAVSRGEIWAERKVLMALLERPKLAPPTPREYEVLQLLTGGYSNRQIAERLGISINTVKAHVTALLKKYGAKSRLDLVTHYVE